MLIIIGLINNFSSTVLVYCDCQVKTERDYFVLLSIIARRTDV